MSAYRPYQLFGILAGFAIVGTVQVHADGIPTPGCTAEALMDTTYGSGADLNSAPTYAAAEVQLPYPGVFEARSLAASAFGFNPVPETKTYIKGMSTIVDISSYSYSKATNVLAWTPASGTLPGETPIVARYSIDLAGILESFGNNTHSVEASLDMWFAVYDPAVGQLASLSGAASIEKVYPPVVFAETGDLIGRFTWDGEYDTTAEIDTQFTIGFNAMIGSTYLIEVILESGLDAGGLTESWSSSDFYSTLTYQFLAAYDPADKEFTTPLDVHMVTIPEPAALALLALGGMALVRRKNH